MSRFGIYPSDAKQLHDCFLDWKRNYQSQHVRFGQYMYNMYVHDGKPWPELFYAEEFLKAYDLVTREIYGE